jgi:predicted nucleic acid-binding protein
MGVTPGPSFMAGTRIGVARRVLLDTGFLVALVNAKDVDHEACVAVWKTLRAQIFSVEGVLVECAHLLQRVRGGTGDAIRIVFESGTQVVPLTSERATRASSLMEKYHDTPMDLVDALLVATAEDENIREILTLDRRGFETFRISGRTRFRLFP